MLSSGDSMAGRSDLPSPLITVTCLSKLGYEVDPSLVSNDYLAKNFAAAFTGSGKGT